MICFAIGQLRLQTAEFNIPVTSRFDALKCIVFNGRMHVAPLRLLR